MSVCLTAVEATDPPTLCPLGKVTAQQWHATRNTAVSLHVPLLAFKAQVMSFNVCKIGKQ
jgi:hypothetical protein